jgi:hypothetical protein
MNTDAQTHADFTLDRDAWGRLVLTHADQRRTEDVDVVRAFPISSPNEIISICDAGGHEIVCIDDIGTLPPRLREVVEKELADREFTPVVERIESVAADADPSQWRVTTNRGPVAFLMEDSDNDVRRLGPDRILLVDAHGIRYLIPDARRLDAASRRILDRYL